jgi:hypothetical protein
MWGETMAFMDKNGSLKSAGKLHAAHLLKNNTEYVSRLNTETCQYT